MSATEISLTESDGIRVGQRVRIAERWAMRMQVAGIGEPTITTLRTGGTVERIEAHPDGEWVSVAVRLDTPAVHADGSRMGPVHWEAPEHLEAVS